MQSRGELNLFLKGLMCVATLSLLLAAGRGGKLPESKHFFYFIRALDPESILTIGWNGTVPHPCSYKWKGVKCNSQATAIREIKLENLNLSGIIDADSLCKLPFLQILSLAQNLIQGSIPDSISNCRSLTFLNLSSNLLNGSIPVALTRMKNLRSLDISNNHFTGFVLSFKQEKLENHRKYSVESSLLIRISTKDPVKAMTPSFSPSGSPESSTPNNEGQNWLSVAMWIPLVLGIGLFMFLAYIVGKKAAKLAKDGEILKSLRDSPLKIPAAKASEEEKLEDRCSELVFFVEEHERFKLEELLESEANLRSQSLCSSLYKVTLKNDVAYAVKRLKKLLVSFDEFGQTMRQIGNLKHPNILPLVGYNSTNEEKLLIYKFQKNGSLLSLLEDYAKGKRDFPWRLRLSIAHGIARGLEVINRRFDNRESIPHGNIKLSNILLNENEEPLISEYGFSRFLDPNRTCFSSSNGYRAPEKSLTQEGDVFSFGIILLELLTGKTVERSGLDLSKWVKSMVMEEWTVEVFDREVNKIGEQWAFPLLNISLKCVSHSPEDRPTITEVLEKLEEVLNSYEDACFSPGSSIETPHQECCILHTVIPETWDTPGSNY